MLSTPSSMERIIRRIPATLFGILLMVLGYNQFSYRQPFDGLVLTSGGGIMLLMGLVYSAEWFENIVYSLRIIESIFFATLVAGILSFFIYGPKESVAAALVVGFAAEVTGLFARFISTIKSIEKRGSNVSCIARATLVVFRIKKVGYLRFLKSFLPSLSVTYWKPFSISLASSCMVVLILLMNCSSSS